MTWANPKMHSFFCVFFIAKFFHMIQTLQLKSEKKKTRKTKFNTDGSRYMRTFYLRFYVYAIKIVAL